MHRLLQQLNTLKHHKESKRKAQQKRSLTKHLKAKAIEDSARADRKKSDLKTMFRRMVRALLHFRPFLCNGANIDFAVRLATMPGRHSGDQVHKVKKAAAPSFLFYGFRTTRSTASPWTCSPRCRSLLTQ